MPSERNAGHKWFNGGVYGGRVTVITPSLLFFGPYSLRNFQKKSPKKAIFHLNQSVPHPPFFWSIFVFKKSEKSPDRAIFQSQSAPPPPSFFLVGSPPTKTIFCQTSIRPCLSTSGAQITTAMSNVYV